uniref:Uncharacterized protein n=1 Tax=Magallana gigas TaxID=29159 RepID=K1QX06_MAGGI
MIKENVVSESDTDALIYLKNQLDFDPCVHGLTLHIGYCHHEDKKVNLIHNTIVIAHLSAWPLGNRNWRSWLVAISNIGDWPAYSQDSAFSRARLKRTFEDRNTLSGFKDDECLRAFTSSTGVRPEACSTERVLASARQNSLYPQHKFWRALAGALSAEHASALAEYHFSPMTATSAHIWQSSEKYRWNTGDVLGRGATAVVYKARHLEARTED